MIRPIGFMSNARLSHKNIRPTPKIAVLRKPNTVGTLLNTVAKAVPPVAVEAIMSLRLNIPIINGENTNSAPPIAIRLVAITNSPIPSAFAKVGFFSIHPVKPFSASVAISIALV